MEMFVNNRQLLDKITEEQILFFITIMKKRGKLARFESKLTGSAIRYRVLLTNDSKEGTLISWRYYAPAMEQDCRKTKILSAKSFW